MPIVWEGRASGTAYALELGRLRQDNLQNRMTDHTTLTLGQLLAHQDPTVKRGAMGILKQLQRLDTDTDEKFHRMVQNWGEQYPAFHTREHMRWLRNKQKHN